MSIELALIVLVAEFYPRFYHTSEIPLVFIDKHNAWSTRNCSQLPVCDFIWGSFRNYVTQSFSILTNCNYVHLRIRGLQHAKVSKFTLRTFEMWKGPMIPYRREELLLLLSAYVLQIFPATWNSSNDCLKFIIWRITFITLLL